MSAAGARLRVVGRGERDVDDRAIARWRLHRFGLVGPGHATPEDAIGPHLAVQAENHAQSSWAIADRLAAPIRDVDLARRFDAGTYLRTHVLRSTWHVALPDDLGWLLALTAPRIRRSFVSFRREHDVDDALLERTRSTIVDAVAEGPCTRAQLGDRLRDDGLPGEGFVLGLVLMDAELEALICSGPLRDGEHTYAAFADRAPDARVLTRDVAVAELALRYFTGHGPATERDLAYWATMTLTDARAGIAAAGDRLRSFEHAGRRYWHAGDPPPADELHEPRGHLLQVLDELHNGYQDSRHVIDTDGVVPRGRRTEVGMALVDGQMVAGMRRSVTETAVRFELHPFRTLDTGERAAIDDAAARYGRFLDREPEVRWAPRS